MVKIYLFSIELGENGFPTPSFAGWVACLSHKARLHSVEQAESGKLEKDLVKYNFFTCSCRPCFCRA